MEERAHEVTRLLAQWQQGDRNALDRLFPLVYDELRGLAVRHLRGERAGHTLQPTALVHEAYLRLVPRENVALRDRAQFLAVAAQAIRRVLVDHARGKLRAKRGKRPLRVSMADVAGATPPPDLNLLALDEALDRLGAEDDLNRQVVELRFFGGMTDDEAASALGIGGRTVRRRWTYARAWLYRELSGDRSGTPG